MFLQSYTNKDENRLSGQVEIRRRQYSILRSSLTRRLAQTIRFIPLASNVSTDLYLFCFIFFLFYMSFARVKVGGLSLVFLQVTLCRPIFWRGSARLQTLEGTIVDLVCVSLFLSFFLAYLWWWIFPPDIQSRWMEGISLQLQDIFSETLIPPQKFLLKANKFVNQRNGTYNKNQKNGNKTRGKT